MKRIDFQLFTLIIMAKSWKTIFSKSVYWRISWNQLKQWFKVKLSDFWLNHAKSSSNGPGIGAFRLGWWDWEQLQTLFIYFFGKFNKIIFLLYIHLHEYTTFSEPKNFGWKKFKWSLENKYYNSSQIWSFHFPSPERKHRIYAIKLK